MPDEKVEGIESLDDDDNGVHLHHQNHHLEEGRQEKAIDCKCGHVRDGYFDEQMIVENGGHYGNFACSQL